MGFDIQVVDVDARIRAQVTDSVTRAFLDDPMWRCIVPDRDAHGVMLRPMWDALIGFAHVYGRALTTPKGEGVACWIAPGQTRTTLRQMFRTGFGLPRSMMKLPKDARNRFLPMMRFIDAQRRELAQEPHWYLWVLGVAPEAQGRGIGTALLRPILDLADRPLAGTDDGRRPLSRAMEAMPCYLETETEENVAFYRGRGFEVIRQAAEPVAGLPIWFMRRPSRPGAR